MNEMVRSGQTPRNVLRIALLRMNQFGSPPLINPPLPVRQVDAPIVTAIDELGGEGKTAATRAASPKPPPMKACPAHIAQTFAPPAPPPEPTAPIANVSTVLEPPNDMQQWDARPAPKAPPKHLVALAPVAPPPKPSPPSLHTSPEVRAAAEADADAIANAIAIAAAVEKGRSAPLAMSQLPLPPPPGWDQDVDGDWDNASRRLATPQLQTMRVQPALQPISEFLAFLCLSDWQ